MSYFYTAEALSLHSVMLGILSKLQSHFFGHYPELVSIGEGKGIESLVNHQICFPLSGFSSPQHPTVESDVMQILFIPRFPSSFTCKQDPDILKLHQQHVPYADKQPFTVASELEVLTLTLLHHLIKPTEINHPQKSRDESPLKWQPFTT